MRILLTLSVWFLLFAICWPLAILVLVLWPIVWLISLPFRLLGIPMIGVLAIITALFLFPFNISPVNPQPC